MAKEPAIEIDGEIKHECIIKGDDVYKCIAAASILAKEYRDEYIEREWKFLENAWNKKILEEDTKDGSRVRGSLYKGIRIVGDYYKFKSRKTIY